MNIKEKLPPIIIGLFLIGGIGIFVSKFFSSDAGATIVDVKIPKLSELAETGKKNFDANCAQCHGENGSGSDQGPPLIHNIYNPGHHADAAFYMAAKRGVNRHHWSFGDMPPQPQVKEKEMKVIVQYVREVQRANGIYFKEHNM